MENNLMKVEEQGFFKKIKNFFKKLFNKKVENAVNEKKDNVIENKTNFLSNIKVDENVKKETDLIGLKEQYDKELITENELKEEQIVGLIKLYDEQIAKLKEKIGQDAVSPESI